MESIDMTANQPTAKKKILIVDDEPGLVTYLETLLQDNGYDTISAADGEQGFQKLRGERPDLVTLDISMPQTSGVRFYRNAKEDPNLAKIPVVIVTAVTGEAGEPEAFKKFISTRRQVPPPEGYIAKPIEPEALLRTIRDLLRA
jgi:CheY-like chemotaxis protein